MRSAWLSLFVSFVSFVVSPRAIRAATGTIQDVQHVVILMMENRSFDSYFGSLYGVRGFSDSNALLFTNGNSVFYQPESNTYVLPFHPPIQCLEDLGHDWWGGHLVWDRGKWDQWVPQRSARTMCYCTRADLPFYYALADAYTICDAYYCPIFGPTYPNRIYELTGMIDPNGTGGGPVLANWVPTNGLTWTTYPQRLQAAGISWKVYWQSNDFFDGNPLAYFAQYKTAQPGNPLYDNGMAMVTSVVGSLLSDISNGTLPQVSWIVPIAGASDHPPLSPTAGEIFVKQVLDALASNPTVFNSTVFMLTYDENDGFFDHMPPPVPQVGTPDEFVAGWPGWPIGPGFRVPMIVVSPWSRGGFVCSQVFDHTSIIRFLEARFGVMEPNISAWRRQVCGDLTSAFDFTSFNTNYPSLPSTTLVWCGNGADPSPPTPQVFPAQEPGTRPARPLPYQPNAMCSLDCAGGRLCITMANYGSASVQFSIYPNAYRGDGPWWQDVPGQSSTGLCLDVLTNGAGLYDLTCYAPNGFQRRFAGNLNANCGQLEVRSRFDFTAGALVLVMTNGTAAPVTFTVTDNYQITGPQNYAVPTGGTAFATFPAVTNNNGWYDLVVTASSDSSFLRRLAGHIETGASATPPVPRFGSGGLVISVSASGGNLLLSYPAWATNYTLESNADLTTTNWIPTGLTPTVTGNLAQVSVQITNGAAFFRLHQ